MRGITEQERRELVERVGKDMFEKRIHFEDHRELKLGGRLRLCPMRLFKPTLRAAFKMLGLWKRGYRNFLNPIIRKTEFGIHGLHPDLDGYTILHLSDLHLDLDTALTPVLLERLKGLHYDIAVVTGDFNNFTVHTPEGLALAEMQKLMPALTAPTFGILGNHDSLRDVHLLESMGVRMLINECVTLQNGNGTFTLAGIDDPNIYKTHDFERTLKNRSAIGPTILLAHSPCIHNEIEAFNFDVVLAGHTHGGQICLPKGRIIASHIDSSSEHVRSGYWREGATQGWTSTGTGACGIPIRLNCPSEILLHTLRTK